MNYKLIIENKEFELNEFFKKVKVTVLSFNRKLVKLYPNEFPPRYNKITISIDNQTDSIIEDLLLTIIRTGSKIGEDNFDILPIKTYGLKSNQKAKYEIKAFDPFNEKFDKIQIRLSTIDDWNERKKSDSLIKRAEEFSKRINGILFNIFK